MSVVYVALGWQLSALHAFWSSDCGARFAIVRNLLEHGSFLHLYYPARSLDPSGEINALVFYLYRTKHDFVPQYEPLFPLLTAIPYSLFGFRGLLLVPLLSGIGALWFVYQTARKLKMLSAPFLPLAIGLGTPLLVYSALYWDHSLMMLDVAATIYCITSGLVDGIRKQYILAGAIIGAGLFIHELLLGVAVALLLASIPLARIAIWREGIASFAFGYLPVALLWAITNTVIYGNPAGPHLSANMGGNTSDHKFSVGLILNIPQLLNRAQIQIAGIGNNGILLTDQHQDMIYLFRIFIALLALIPIACIFLGKLDKLTPLLWLIPALLAFFLVTKIGSANGLFEATPLFIPALTLPWLGRKRSHVTERHLTSQTERTQLVDLFYRWAFLYILICIGNPILPGIDWGARYLLPVLPLLAILAATTMESQYVNAKGVDRTFAALVIGCICTVSFYNQTIGIRLAQSSMLVNRDLIRTLSTISTKDIVYVDEGLGAQASAVSLPAEQFVVRDEADWELFCQVLKSQRLPEFTFVGTAEDGLGIQCYPSPASSGILSIRCIKQNKTGVHAVNCPPIDTFTFVELPNTPTVRK